MTYGPWLLLLLVGMASALTTAGRTRPGLLNPPPPPPVFGEQAIAGGWEGARLRGLYMPSPVGRAARVAVSPTPPVLSESLVSRFRAAAARMRDALHG